MDPARLTLNRFLICRHLHVCLWLFTGFNGGRPGSYVAGQARCSLVSLSMHLPAVYFDMNTPLFTYVSALLCGTCFVPAVRVVSSQLLVLQGSVEQRYRLASGRVFRRRPTRDVQTVSPLSVYPQNPMHTRRNGEPPSA